VYAILDLGEEKLLMTNNVHLTITERDKKIDLFSEKINFDMRNKNFRSKNQVQMKSTSFRLNSNGFDLFQNSNGANELIFSKAAFEENNASKNSFYGEADLIIYKSPSDTFTLKGSAEIKFESTLISAEEIEFNFKTKKIISSKRSKIIKS
jgi:lipopolysaccharide transport protein LptA